MSSSLLEIQHISKKFGDYQALNDISLTINVGEIMSLLGINGAGKTTLSSIVATLKPPTSGDILFQETSIYQDLMRFRQNIGYCPQKPNLNDHLTMRENLHFAGKYYGLPENVINERIEQLAQQFRFTNYLTHNPTTLSGGYKQRFLLARSIIHYPKLIILDEPTVALDPHIRRQLWDLILELKSKGLSILLTTHYLDEAEVLSDRVCVLNKGVVSLIDTPANLLSSFNKGRLEDVFIQLTQEE